MMLPPANALYEEACIINIRLRAFKRISNIVYGVGERAESWGEKKLLTNVQCHLINNADKFSKLAEYCPV